MRESAITHPETITRVASGRSSDQYVSVRLTLSTAAIRRESKGLQLEPEETVLVAVPRHPLLPPTVVVGHRRFAGFPHVLTGDELCIYLDPSREWDPAAGVEAFLDRLFRWFEDAAAGRFSGRTALFHPIGGRPVAARDATVVVCRQVLPIDRELSFAFLVERDSHRFDLVASDAPAGAEQVLVARAPTQFPYGPGKTVAELLTGLGEAGGRAWLALQGRLTRRMNTAGVDATVRVHVVVAVPHVDPEAFYLLVGRVSVPSGRSQAPETLDVEWLSVSDDRPDSATRRDQRRPASAFYDRDVLLLGCGGLGSWISEFVARAGARSVALADPARVSGGLLVRQNYADADIGQNKAEALARRLHAVAPECDVRVLADSVFSPRTAEIFAQTGAVLIDATVNRAVAQILDAGLTNSKRRAAVAQVATDVATGSLGMLVYAAPELLCAAHTLDVMAWDAVSTDSRLEPYYTFWNPAEQDELVPAPGCSIPTFHGSAADMAAVAAEMVNLIAAHLNTPVSATHLFALPHSGVQPAHHIVTHPTHASPVAAGDPDAAGDPGQ
ncbi:MAG: ThiF family adenylyltransferase [Kineosporiaceae bacterium]|nr:ThiF family adenylyltransferase [Kineosporiaceae bacterium]